MTFSRPHTIAGTTVAVAVLYVCAVAWVGVGAATHVGDFVLALVVGLATNVFIVGVNQLTDVDIDRINKPWLPLAAGTMSWTTGRALVVGSGVVAVVGGAIAGRWMLAAAVIGLLVGTAYSVPPLRLKRSHLLAAASITSVRALVVNVFVYLHFQQVLGGGGGLPRHVQVLTAMVLGLTVAIAWFKDLPDAEGDAAHGIATLPIVLGPSRVLAIGLAVLAACYLAVVAIGARGLVGVSDPWFVVGHLVLLAALGVMASRVDLADHGSIQRFYHGIWLLFVAEYLVVGAAVLAA